MVEIPIVFLDRFQRLIRSGVDEVSQDLSEIDTKIVRANQNSRMQRRHRIRLAAMLTLAASVVALAAGVAWLVQPKPDMAGGDNRSQIRDIVPDKPIVSSDVDSSDPAYDEDAGESSGWLVGEDVGSTPEPDSRYT